MMKFFKLTLLMLLITQTSHSEGVVNFYNWSDYIGENTIENFEKEYGIKINYDTYESSEIVEAKLLSGNSGYDLVMHCLLYTSDAADE